MKEAVIKVALQPGIDVLSEEEIKKLIMNGTIAKDLSILGKVTEVSINQKQ